MAPEPPHPADRERLPGPEPTAAEPPDALAEEARVGGTAAARAVNLALLALSRTARSFQLYDPRNEAITQFLEDLQVKMDRALAAGGDLALELRPFEIAWNGDVVYVERDRDRSLAFRLFKDGLRRLTFARGLGWDEVLGLLEILSVRYTGVRQQEDDVVTLLGKAGFPHVGIEAIEGFVPDEEIPEEDEPAPSPTLGIEAPPDWDLPLPAALPPVRLERRPLDPAALAALQAEEAPEALAANTARLTQELLACVMDPSDPMGDDDVALFVSEVRDFLLGEGALDALVEVVEALQATASSDIGHGESLVASFGTDAAVRRLLAALPPWEGEPPERLLRLLSLVPGDHLARAIDRLAAERQPEARERWLRLVGALAPGNPDLVLSRTGAADDDTARELLAVFAAVAPYRAGEAALLLKDRADAGVQVEVLRVLATLPYSTVVGRTAMGLMRSEHEAVQLAAVELLSSRGEQRAFEGLVRHVEEHAATGLSPVVADAIGAALARLSPDTARAQFEAWIKPKGLLGKLVETAAAKMKAWTAVSGLGRLPGEEAEARVRAFMEHAGPELRQHCVTTLVQRRRRAQQAARL